MLNEKPAPDPEKTGPAALLHLPARRKKETVIIILSVLVLWSVVITTARISTRELTEQQIVVLKLESGNCDKFFNIFIKWFLTNFLFTLI